MGFLKLLRIFKRMILQAYKDQRIKDDLFKKFPTIKIDGKIDISGPLSNLHLGENVRFYNNIILHLGGMDWCQEKGCIEIGDNSFIYQNCVIYGAGPYGVIIGKNFSCSQGTHIFASVVDYRKDYNCHIFKPVRIGDNVMIFTNVVIGPGVKIGDNAVIASGSVVLSDVPSNVLVGGAPARVLRENIKTNIL